MNANMTIFRRDHLLWEHRVQMQAAERAADRLLRARLLKKQREAKRFQGVLESRAWVDED